MYYLCPIPLAPMRAQASHRAEMVNQLVFGECCSLIEESYEWLLLRSTFDQYEGYVDKQQMLALNTINTPLVFTHTNTQAERINTAEGQMLIPAGSMLSKTLMQLLKIEHLPPSARPFSPIQNKQALCSWAKNLVNTPYLWGGKSQMGFDCSGFIQSLYRMAGYQLNRDASQQAQRGININFLEEVQAGDLAFFDNAEGLITHVGMLLSPFSIIHASGKVRIDPIDHHGIYQKTTKNYSHKLRVIKRML